MLSLKACTVCFSMDSKLTNMDESQLRYDYNTVSGLQTSPNDGMLAYLCVECYSYVHRFMNFQLRCQKAYFALKSILHKNINRTDLEALQNSGYDIASPLSYVNLNRVHYEEIHHSDASYKQIIPTPSMKTGLIPISSYSISIKDENECVISNVVKMVYEKNQGTFDQETNNINTAKLDCIALKSENSHNDRDDLENRTNSNQILSDQDTISDPELDNSSSEFGNANKDLNHYPFSSETSIMIEITTDEIDNDSHESDSENYEPPEALTDDQINMSEKNDEGVSVGEKYAFLKPLTMTEAHAVMAVKKMFGIGKYLCNICNSKHISEKAYKDHYRRHEKYTNGIFLCEICKYYYKTDNLLKVHMTEKHLYKYICRKCPEVNFDRVSAKHHFSTIHCEKTQNSTKGESASDRHSNSGVNQKEKPKVTHNSTKKPKRNFVLPADFLKYTPQSQEEQYDMITQRQHSKNYKTSAYKCDLCFRGFLSNKTYSNHMKGHDPAIAGDLECDMCKMRYKTVSQMYFHIRASHLFKYECQHCDYVSVQRGSAMVHYLWHKNRTSKKCPHCDREYRKPSSLTSHMRVHHPTTFICNICGHSYVSKMGLLHHKRRAHTEEEKKNSASVTVHKDSPLYCADCNVQFFSDEAFNRHLDSSSKHVTVNVAGKRSKNLGDKSQEAQVRSLLWDRSRISTTCDVCGKFLASEVKRVKHYQTEHPDARCPGRFMCEYCGYIAVQFSHLHTHMRKHRKELKKFHCVHCDRWFATRHILENHVRIHTGEKPFECSQCHRCFRQKYTLIMHVRTVHMKIPYPPWNKKNRKRKANPKPASPSFDFPTHYSQSFNTE